VTDQSAMFHTDGMLSARLRRAIRVLENLEGGISSLRRELEQVADLLDPGGEQVALEELDS
jgi:hypothetical protein